MKYFITEHVPATTRTTEHYVSSCIKCGSNNLKVFSFEDNDGPPIYSVECGCGRKVKRSDSLLITIAIWNKRNDPAFIAEDTREKIEKLKKVMIIAKGMERIGGRCTAPTCTSAEPGTCDSCKDDINFIINYVDKDED